MVKLYVQGDKKTDKELFGWVGPWVVNKSVHKLLGMPVTSEPGSVWLVNFTKPSEPDGFAELRPQTNQLFHLRYLYGQTQGARTTLAKEAIQFAKNHKATGIYTNERSTDKLWRDLEFKPYKRKNTSFSRWEKCFV